MTGHFLYVHLSDRNVMYQRTPQNISIQVQLCSSDDVLEPLSQHSRAGGAGSGDVLEPLSL